MLVALDPDDEARRVLAVSKCNLAERAESLAFRLTSDELYGCARITWEGAVGHDANDLIRESVREERSLRDEAAAFLSDVLSEGPVAARKVKQLGRDAGFSDRTLDRARDCAGVRARRDGFGPGAQYVWEMARGHARQEISE
jgi:hypothetical protein